MTIKNATPDNTRKVCVQLNAYELGLLLGGLEEFELPGPCLDDAEFEALKGKLKHALNVI
jgi:hypothetical protein